MQVRMQQLDIDIEQHTDSKLEKEYLKAVYCLCACLTSMQGTSCKAQPEIKIAGRGINNLRCVNDSSLMAESKELKSLLLKVKEESEKVDLKLNIKTQR